MNKNKESKKNTKHLFYLFLGFTTFSIITISLINLKNENNLNSQNLSYLKTSNYILNNYSEEAIKYFYKIAYYSEVEKSKQSIINRWEKDLKIYAHGNPPKEYINYLKINANKINSLKLGVNVFMVNDPRQANVDVYFGSKSNLDTLFNPSLNYSGIGILYSKGGRIDKAKIGVIVTDTSSLKVKYILLEEMIQTLGLVGDSFTDKESLFYEVGHNKYNDLTDLDIEILKLLYDPNVSSRTLTRKNYESLFEHLLPNVNREKKILKDWEKTTPSKSVLERIRRTCFDKDSVFRKFTGRTIKVNLRGEVFQKDSLIVSKIING